MCERHQVAASDAPYEIRDLTPADAEKHLRALMMEVAKRCNHKLGFVWLGDEDDMALIDEALNAAERKEA